VFTQKNTNPPVTTTRGFRYQFLLQLARIIHGWHVPEPQAKGVVNCRKPYRFRWYAPEFAKHVVVAPDRT
jgi:hypothetical protein